MTTSSVPPLKCCSKCNQEFPASPEYFHRQKRHKSGLRSECRVCIQQRSARYRADNLEAIRENCRLYAALTYDKRRDYFAEWYQANRDRVLAEAAAWRAANLELALERERRYTASTNDDVRKRSERYRAENRERLQQQNKTYYLKRPDVVLAIQHRRAARKRSLPHTFTTADWQRALEYFNGCCAVCGRPPGLWHTIALDHWIPLSSPDCPGTVATNIVPMCHAKAGGVGGCNNSKYNTPPLIWLERKFGEQRALVISEWIETYFVSVAVSQNADQRFA